MELALIHVNCICVLADLSSKDEQIKKLVDEKMDIIAELRVSKGLILEGVVFLLKWPLIIVS